MINFFRKNLMFPYPFRCWNRRRIRFLFLNSVVFWFILGFPLTCFFWVCFLALFIENKNNETVRRFYMVAIVIWFFMGDTIVCSFFVCFVLLFFKKIETYFFSEQLEIDEKKNKLGKKKYRQPWFFTICYLVFILILPLFSLLNTASQTIFDNFWERATNPVALSAYTVTISMAFIASTFNAFFGFILAWVLIRYNFPGKRLLDAAVDLPFALPTSVAGLTLSTIYNDVGWIGSFLTNLGVQIVFTKLGTLLAMIFVSFPFVVRTLQPVLQGMEIELEEASWSLGGSPWKTFQKVIFPPLIPAVLTGFTLAFSRAIGEYGSVVIISSNIPLEDLVASVLIFQNLEQYDYTGATVIGTIMLILSLFLLIGINFLQNWNQKSFKF